MRRKLFNLAAAVSLVCCVMAVGMWVRSRTNLEAVGSSSAFVASGDKEMVFYLRTPLLRFIRDLEYLDFGKSDGSQMLRKLLETRTPSVAYGPVWGGDLPFGIDAYVYLSRFDPARVYVVAGVLPYWLIVTFSAILPGIWLIVRLRHRRRTGLCPQCGYDLRATPERCPECGKEVIVKPPTAVV